MWRIIPATPFKCNPTVALSLGGVTEGMGTRGPCGARCPVHIETQLRCCDPRGATSCGSPMPRAEQFANPTERDRRLAGSFFKRTADRLARLGRTEEHR